MTIRDVATRVRQGLAGLVARGRALFSGGRGAAATMPNAAPATPAPVVEPTTVLPSPAAKLTDLTGPGHTDRWGFLGTDLGIPVTTPDGRLLLVFGDTFAEATAAGAPQGWRTPTALYADPASLAGGLRWTGAAVGDLGGGAQRAGQLVPQPHHTTIHGMPISTQLPSDVVEVDGTLYLQVMGNRTFPDVGFTELYASRDNGMTWASTGCWWRGDQWSGWFQCLTFCPGDDGYLYCFSTAFPRTTGLMLSRVRLDRMLQPRAWRVWNPATGTWGDRAVQVLGGQFGESSLRRVDGQWVLCVFDNLRHRIDVRVLPTITADLTTVPVTTVITDHGWEHEDHAHGQVAQPYGGYIVPGSTLDDLHLVVSQWNTVSGTNWPYRAMHFRTSIPTAARPATTT